VKLFGVVSVDLLSAVHQDLTETVVGTGSSNQCFGDGTFCLPYMSCNQCCTKETYWFSKFSFACGTEPCWKDATLCMPGGNCHKCCASKPGQWFSKGGMIACGEEPCWPSQHPCLPYPGGSCNRCCNSFNVVSFQEMMSKQFVLPTCT